MRHRPIVVLLLVYTGDAFAAGGCPKDGVRWASTSNRIYVTGEVECTLPDLREALPAEVPLTEVEEGVWYLGANVFLEQGATLAVDGSSHGGTVDELRLKSDGSGFVELRAEWGNLYLRGTHVTSWDEREGGPDTDHEGGRAFIRAVSFLDGATPRQSRMDVIDSEIAYLGYYAAESYGLSWKVRDPSPDVFEKVDVLGDITNSRIHHNYFGMYSYGAYGMRITGSEFHDNVMYGIDPHDDSDGLLVEGNYTHDNGNHGFICSKRCDGLTVRGNTSSNNAGVGYMFHRAVENSVLEDNLAENNVDAGFAIMDSHKNIVRRNVARGNKYGLRYSVGASENVAEDNDLSGNTMYGIYMYQGTDAPTINDGCPQDNVFQRNDATSNGILGMRASCAKGNTFAENLFGDNASYAVFLFDSPDNVFSANDLGGSYIHVQGDSETHLRDTDTAGVLLGDDSASVRLGDTRGRVFEVGPGVVTRVGEDGSTARLTRADGTGVIDVAARTLVVAPRGGEVDVELVSWTPVTRSWRTTPATALGAGFTIGGLRPGSRHVLTVNGIQSATVTADQNGEVRFTSQFGRAPSTYTLTSAARPGPVPVIRREAP